VPVLAQPADDLRTDQSGTTDDHDLHAGSSLFPGTSAFPGRQI
jgi:hypothetical protein